MRVLLAAAIAAFLLLPPAADVWAQAADPFQSVPTTRPAAPPKPHPASPRARSVPDRADTDPAGPQALQPVARPGQPGWTTGPDARCSAWNVAPAPDETIAWNGPCRNGMASGSGHLQWYAANGTVEEDYQGQFVNGRMEGHCVQTLASGERYDGEWHGGLKHGHGIWTWPNGNRFDGELLNGKANGPGQMVTPTQTYSGIWVNGCFRDGTRWARVGDGTADSSCQ
jgi:hypothetical protein